MEGDPFDLSSDREEPHHDVVISPEDRLLTVIEVADWLQTSNKFVYSLIAKGDLPAIKLRSSVRVERAAVVNFIDRNRTQTEGASDRGREPPEDRRGK
jgi:excisionase family DNA binding protein